MDIYQTEEEQVEALKKWWAQNGKSAIFGVVLGLAAIFGWREWQDYETSQAASASLLYQDLVIAARENDIGDMEKNAKKITAQYGSTAYAMFARLSLARIAVEKGELDEAATELQLALDEVSEDSLQHIIRLRLARVLIATDKHAEASKVLAQQQQRGEFEVGYLELEADLLRQDKKLDGARDTYQKALTLAQSSGQDTSILDMKLDDLGRK